MIYSFSLSQVSIWAGLGLLLSHGWGLLDYRQASQWIRSFPRGDGLGGAFGFCYGVVGVVSRDDQSDGIYAVPPTFILGVVGLGVTSWLYVREFIAVRSLGILFLLAGDVFWMQPSCGMI